MDWVDSLIPKLTMNKAKGFILQKKPGQNKNFTDDNVYFDQANCQKIAKFWISQVRDDQCLLSIYTTDYSNKGALPKHLD